MSYAELTRADPNPIKRWLQEERLEAALRLVPADARRVLDYGAGDGEVAARLARRRPEAEVICFEPAPELRQQAASRTAGLAGVSLASAEDELPSAWADALLCLEVFEHLPQAETSAALDAMERVLRPGGVLIVGVPQEIGPVAAAKGLFRMARRSDQFDARLSGIVGAVLGQPPGERPIAEIAPGRAYHPFHLGFDHRDLIRTLEGSFRIRERTGTPFGRALSMLNSELYITAVKP